MTAPRPFRFSVSLGSAPSREAWRAKARRVEELGFDVLMVADHVADGVFPPFEALASAAEAAPHIRLGTLVLNNDLRHPALVARQAAALDLLSDGRFELGLGAGHMEAEYTETGQRFDPSDTRVRRLAEATGLIARLLSGETVSFAGEHYTLREHAVFPRPIQQPLPLRIGGNARAVLELAGREASSVGFTGFFASEGGRRVVPAHFAAHALEERLAIVREAAAARFESLELHALVQAVIPGDDVRAAAEGLRARLPALSTGDLLESPFLLLGSPERMADALLERRARFGLSHFTVFEAAMEAFAPVVASLRGR